jgi:hypothetical protein
MEKTVARLRQKGLQATGFYCHKPRLRKFFDVAANLVGAIPTRATTE